MSHPSCPFLEHFSWEKQMCHLPFAEDNDKGYRNKSNCFWWRFNWGTSSLCQRPCDLPHPAVITSFQLETELLPTVARAFLPLLAIFFLKSWSLFIRTLLFVKIVLPQTQKTTKFALALLSHNNFQKTIIFSEDWGNTKSCSPFGVNSGRGHV